MPRAGRMTEKELQTSVNRALAEHGWAFHHDATSALVQRVPDGAGGMRWARIKANSRAGFPDIVAAKGLTLLVWELKDDTGKPTPDQILWLDWWGTFAVQVNLAGIGVDIHVALIRPRDLEAAYMAIMGLDADRWPREWSAERSAPTAV